METLSVDKNNMQQDGDLHDYQSGQLGENFLPDNLQLNTERDTHESTGTSILEAGSIRDLNGRTYQGYREGKYFLPNDPIEQDRLDFQHAGLTTLLGDMLSWVPFATSPPHNVLDVATGTGLWAMDFARLYPTANVLGSDLSRIQPEDSKPANCSFVQEDAEEPWLHPKNHFDYIHFRLVTTCFDHPQSVIQQAYESLAPGGWIEFHDAGPLLLGAEGTVAERTWQMAVEGAAAMGRNIEVAQNYKRWLLEAGFTDVQEYKLPWPMNGWHENPRIKKSGRYMQRVLLDNAQGMVYKMLQGKGLSPSEIEVQVQQCKEEFMDESIHGYWPFYVVYGRPLFILALPDTIVSDSLRFEHLVQMGRLAGAFTISPVQLIAMSWIKKTESYEQTFDLPQIYSALKKDELRILILEAGPPGSEISCRLLEVVCAKKIVVLGGQERLSWDNLAKPVVELSRSGLLEGSLTEKGQQGARAVVDMDEIRNTTRQGNPPDLLSLLLQTSAAESLDIRDKVYGVLSLARDYDPVKDGTFLKPDYFISPQELYTKVARWCLEKANLEIVLSCATTSKQSDWPSWVPDWGNIDNSFPFSRYLDDPRHEIPWNATNAGRPYGLSIPSRVPPVIVQGDKLTLHGICVDLISELSPPFRLHHTGRPRTLEDHSSALNDNKNWLAECFEMGSRTARQIEGEHERWRVLYDVKRRLRIIMTASLTGDGCIASDLYTIWFDEYISWLKADYQQWIKNSQEHPENAPDFDWNWDVVDDKKAYIPPKELYNDSVASIESSISTWASRRRFGITQTGRMVLVPQHTVEGDLIVLVQGCRLPYVFRSCGGDQEGMYRVVGEAFVEDMMNGDFFKFISQESKTEKTQEERIFQEFLVG